MQHAIAFYKGKGNWLDRLIRLVSGTKYSHCEYVHDYFQDHISVENSTCLSSSPRDRGVRTKEVDLNSGNWDVITVPWHTADSRIFFAIEAGKKYDYLGVAFCHFFSFRWNMKSRWFCSEICAAALGFDAPETYSPSSLKLAVEMMSGTYAQGFDKGWDEAKENFDV